MSDQLPPSKFGAGYTYGGDQPEPTQRIQQPPPPPSYDAGPGNAPTTAYPTYPQGPDPYAGGQYEQPTAQYAPPPQYGQAPPQYGQAPQQYSAPPPGYQPGSSGGGGGGMFAGILAILAGLAHTAWSVPFLIQRFKHADDTKHLIFKDFRSDWHWTWLLTSSIVQVAFGLLLLIAGFLLIGRRGSGRVLASLSLVVLIGITVGSAVIGFLARNAMLDKLNSQIAEAKSQGDIEQEVIDKVVGPAKQLFTDAMWAYNGVFWWFSGDFRKAADAEGPPPKEVMDTLNTNFIIQCIAVGVLTLVSVVALIAAMMAKTGQRTAALATAPYGY
ncbi:MAG: hypothetical protein QOH60_4482 [Mycobacterium sp.]|nr:hypothetical protein [Mycobacterium sp.]